LRALRIALGGAGALAPIFSEILFSTDPTPIASVPLALLTELAVGFILPPAAGRLSRAHMSFSLAALAIASRALPIFEQRLHALSPPE
jgi:hypothetical protein